MKFLIDHRLPPALGLVFEEAGHEAVSIAAVGMERARDQEVWTFASSEGLVFVTKDRDFLQTVDREQHRGRIVWIKFGDCRVPQLLKSMREALPGMLKTLESAAPIPNP